MPRCPAFPASFFDPFRKSAIQLRGKLRRYVQANLIKQDHEALLARRQGECNRCGACCKILFRCPFLGTDAEGQYTCSVYEKRFAQCRLYPLHAAEMHPLPPGGRSPRGPDPCPSSSDRSECRRP